MSLLGVIVTEVDGGGRSMSMAQSRRVLLLTGTENMSLHFLVQQQYHPYNANELQSQRATDKSAGNQTCFSICLQRTKESDEIGRARGEER